MSEIKSNSDIESNSGRPGAGRGGGWVRKVSGLGRSMASVVAMDVVTSPLVEGLADAGVWCWVVRAGLAVFSAAVEELGERHRDNAGGGAGA